MILYDNFYGLRLNVNVIKMLGHKKITEIADKYNRRIKDRDIYFLFY